MIIASSAEHILPREDVKDPWLKSLDAETVKRFIKEAESLGVKEIYFTGGEPFLHRDILELLAFSLPVAPTTVLTNGALITEKVADALASLARASTYSLEMRISMDDIEAEKNDRIRGKGAFAKALRAIQLLHARGLLPILTATEVLQDELPAGSGMDERFRTLLLAVGIDKPRVKIIPVFPIGRMATARGSLLAEEMLRGFDFSLLQCSETRVLADGGSTHARFWRDYRKHAYRRRAYRGRSHPAASTTLPASCATRQG